MKQGEVAVEQRPLALDVVEHPELPGLVVQPLGVLLQRLVAVPEEPLEAVAAAQLELDGVQRGLDLSDLGHGEGGEAEDSEDGGVRLLAVALPRQHGAQHGRAARHLVRHDVDNTGVGYCSHDYDVVKLYCT